MTDKRLICSKTVHIVSHVVRGVTKDQSVKWHNGTLRPMECISKRILSIFAVQELL